MLNLQAYRNRELQNFLSLLSISLKGGVLYIGELEKEINNHLATELNKFKNMKHEKIKIKRCPECGSIIENIIVGKDIIVSCKKCRYSKYIGEIGGANGR